MKLKRRYVYEETYKAVMEFAKREGLRSPNRKENFPFFLMQMINNLEFYKKYSVKPKGSDLKWIGNNLEKKY